MLQLMHVHQVGFRVYIKSVGRHMQDIEYEWMMRVPPFRMLGTLG